MVHSHTKSSDQPFFVPFSNSSSPLKYSRHFISPRPHSHSKSPSVKMALQIQVSGASLSKPIGPMGSSWPAKNSTVGCIMGEQRREKSLMGLMMKRKSNNNQKGIFCSSLETAGPVVGEVTEVDQESFWPLVNAAGDKVVVLDMYTQWCGPCKIIAPKFQELSKKYTDVVFLKLDCNKENKALAKELGIKVVPTFKILKESKVIKEVTGAKFENLVSAIDSVRST